MSVVYFFISLQKLQLYNNGRWERTGEGERDGIFYSKIAVVLNRYFCKLPLDVLPFLKKKNEKVHLRYFVHYEKKLFGHGHLFRFLGSGGQTIS